MLVHGVAEVCNNNIPEVWSTNVSAGGYWGFFGQLFKSKRSHAFLTDMAAMAAFEKLKVCFAAGHRSVAMIGCLFASIWAG